MKRPTPTGSPPTMITSNNLTAMRRSIGQAPPKFQMPTYLMRNRAPTNDKATIKLDTDETCNV